MAKVLWYGDAGCHTGFAKVTESVGNRLVETYGHDVHALAINYRGDPWDTKVKLWNPSAVQPNDFYGKSRVVEVMAAVEPDVVIMLNDAPVILRLLVDNAFDTERVLLTYRPLIGYIPIDGYNTPKMWDLLDEAMLRVAMTKFGQEAMPGSKLAYHGVDTTLFSQRDRKAAKEMLGFDPDRFLVLRVDKNSIRKNYADTWRALRPLLRKYDDIDVHFHCLPRESMEGVDLKAFIWNDEDIRDRVTFSPNLGGFTGWSEELMPLLYSAADLFVSTSMGEGFGLTIAESLACGTAVVAQGVSAIPEVVGPGGILLEPERPFTVGQGQEQMLPNVGAFTEAIEHLYLNETERRELGVKGRKHVAESFSWDTTAALFHTFIEELLVASDMKKAAKQHH